MKTLKIMIAIFVGIGGLVLISAFYFLGNLAGYGTKDGKMVYKYLNNVNFKVEHRQMGADPKTFKAFGFNKVYGKDKAHVYLEGYKIAEADPGSFKILDLLYQYARDKNNLYGGTKKIGDNPDSFENLGEGFAKDNVHAFYQGRIIEGADGKTFELMDKKGRFAKDHQHIFSFAKIIKESHSPTFRHLEHNFYSDKNHVYHNSQKIEKASPSDFEILGDRYARSANHVFYKKKIIEAADPKTFEVVASGEVGYYAKDKNQKYRYDKPVEEFPERVK